MTTDSASRQLPNSVLGPSLVFGFAAAVAVWTKWFATHVPWVSLAEPLRVGIVLAVWLVVLGIAGAVCGRANGWKVGLFAGLTSSLVGLLMLQAKVAPPPDAVGAPPGLVVVGGFIVLGGAIGLIGGLVGGLLRPGAAAPRQWLPWFGVVTLLAAAPLLFIGGLVTTTDSGLAVPDWPRTMGANMFLYPLGNANVDVFLEHSHRLFGSLVGLTTAVLMVWTLMGEPRRWVKVFSVSVFLAVVVQGVLGGGRVLGQSIPAAIVHAVFAQIIFAGLAALCVALWATPDRLFRSQPFEKDRRIKAVAAAAMHSTIIQVIFGAVYRHMRDRPGAMHALWSHVGFSFVVMVAGLLAGLFAASIPASAGGLPRLLRRLGQAVIVVVLLQVLLGWMAFLMGGAGRVPETVPQALLRTAHQANGALFLALATGTSVLSTMLYRHHHPRHAASPNA